LFHIGINSRNKEEAQDTAEIFSRLFLMKATETDDSYFAGKIAEIMKGPFLGTNGHIGIAVNNFNRAVIFMKKLGIEFLDEGYIEGSVAYLRTEIAGYAVHIKQKY
ncbi:MAG: keto-hydroxyglutarate-aldolase/keto-deoxy-phosphogluconate aldolase, partial [Candidatus Cloacimonetes bacterium]|nr:keto-hydroxyglutarate-aldolase/keto-deoxy-phosphogluconate aldolase [Candidatus Cloacimonadota bacterium]